MTPNHQHRMAAYEALTEDIKILYSSESAASLNGQLIRKYGIGEEQADLFLDITGDVILGFYKIVDLPRMFQQKLRKGADESQRMTSELIEFLGPVVSREEAEARAKKESLDTLAQTFATPALEKIATNEAQEYTGNVEPLRTMEKDINRIHGYGAYVEAQEEKGIEEAETVAPAPSQSSAPLKQNPTFNDDVQ